MPRSLVVNSDIVIPAAELQLTLRRARARRAERQQGELQGGAAVARSWRRTSLPEAVRRRFVTRYANRINVAGELVLSRDEHREQPRNTAACMERLRTMIVAVLDAAAATGEDAAAASGGRAADQAEAADVGKETAAAVSGGRVRWAGTVSVLRQSSFVDYAAPEVG